VSTAEYRSSGVRERRTGGTGTGCALIGMRVRTYLNTGVCVCSQLYSIYMSAGMGTKYNIAFSWTAHKHIFH
jgi:hypothetical protein